MPSLEASRRQSLVTAVAALMGVAGVLNIGATATELEEATNGLIQRVLAQTSRDGITFRATRHLEAGTLAGKHRGWMDVETAVSPNGGFTWKVVSEGGSERTREKVFRAVLTAEAEAWRASGRDSAALSLTNYDFVQQSPTKLELRPRRADSRLVAGVLTVSSDGHPVMLEGRLAKSPSFWVKSVTIVKRYTRVSGVSLPSEIESLADIRMVGKSAFSMRYSYTAVNGRTVGYTASAMPTFSPSPQLLALHAHLRGEQ